MSHGSDLLQLYECLYLTRPGFNLRGPCLMVASRLGCYVRKRRTFIHYKYMASLSDFLIRPHYRFFQIQQYLISFAAYLTPSIVPYFIWLLYSQYQISAMPPTSSLSSIGASTTSTSSTTATAACVTMVPGHNGYVPEYACNANYNYYPSFAAAIIFTVFFGFTTFFHVYQASVFKKWRLCWPLIMGATWELVSFASRTAGTRLQQSTALATVSQLLVLLAPMWFVFPSKKTWCFANKTMLIRQQVECLHLHAHGKTHLFLRTRPEDIWYQSN